MKFDGSFIGVGTSCPGTDSDLISNTICYVPMTTVMAKTALTRDSLI